MSSPPRTSQAEVEEEDGGEKEDGGAEEEDVGEEEEDGGEDEDIVGEEEWYRMNDNVCVLRIKHQTFFYQNGMQFFLSVSSNYFFSMLQAVTFEEMVSFFIIL